MTATISTPGQQIEYTFVTTANKNVTFKVTNFKFSQPGGPDQVNLYFYEPGSSSGAWTDSCTFTANGYCHFTTPVSGTWSIDLVPYEDNVGSLTLTFANDVPTKALSPGTPVTTTISYPGQQASYTFAATANKNVTFKVTNFKFSQPGGPDQVNLYFYEPGNSWPGAWTDSCTFTANGYCHFTTPVSGTWSIELIPYQANVGSLTLTFANDVPTKALIPGTPVTTTISYPGQQASYTFAATANKNVTFKVTNFKFSQPGGPDQVNLYFYEPGNSWPGAWTDSCTFTANTSCTFSTPKSGTWSIELIPYQANVGSLTLELT